MNYVRRNSPSMTCLGTFDPYGGVEYDSEYLLIRNPLDPGWCLLRVSPGGVKWYDTLPRRVQPTHAWIADITE